jgi:transcription elongation factor SPT4
MRGDRERTSNCTTKNFNGCCAQMDLSKSWAVRWLRTGKLLPGMYALSVSDELPAEIVEELENLGV